MFDALAEKVQSAIEKIGRKGRIDEETLEKGLREIKLALLEADVNYRVVSKFIKDIKEKALGAKVIKGVNPAQQLVKIVHDELVETLGGKAEKLNLKGKPSGMTCLPTGTLWLRYIVIAFCWPMIVNPPLKTGSSPSIPNPEISVRWWQ